MVKQIQRILVAIGDLKNPPKNELQKAAAVARACGARVELFHAIDEPDPGRGLPETVTAEGVTRLRAATVRKRQHRLEDFAAGKALRGVKTRCTASWDYPPHEAIIRRALATQADLVIAASRGHRFGARVLLRNTDWELIRHCPVPLLMVKSRRPYKQPVVLAAVDPFHTHAKPADLDSRLLSAAGRFAQLLHGGLHIFHAYMPLIAFEPMSPAPPVMMPSEAIEAHRKMIARVVGDLAAAAGVPPARRHIQLGDVAGELSAVARRTRASLVVMGAVSRSALARLFIGNTAERALDQLGCDILIVKPRGFKSKVARRPAIAPIKMREAVRAAWRPRSSRESTATATRMVLPPLL